MMTGAKALVDIDDDDELYRRIVSFHINSDGSVNSAAFKLRGNPDPSISVDLAKLTTPQECARRPGRPGFGVAVLVAQVPRSLGFTVRHDPNPAEDPGNDAHALIEGDNDKVKCRQLAAAARVLLHPSSS